MTLNKVLFILFLIVSSYNVYYLITNLYVILDIGSNYDEFHSLFLSLYIFLTIVTYEIIFKINKYKLIIITGFTMFFLISYFLKSLYVSYHHFYEAILESYPSFYQYIKWEFISTLKIMTIQVFILIHLFYGLYTLVRYLLKSSNSKLKNEDLLDDNI